MPPAILEKPAITKYPVIESIRKRWSPRAFADQPVEKEKLGSLFEAARWAPSSGNEQPWYFLVATRGDEMFEKLVGALAPGNQTWASRAPVLMSSVARLNLRSGRPNRHAFHDVGLAMGNLLNQATSLGLVVHQMAGFSPEKVREIYGIPSGFEPVAAIAIGYPAPLDTLPPDILERESAPRTRKDLNDFVYAGNWGNPLPGL